MSWAKIDDGFPHHPRAVAAGPLGRDLFLGGLCYAKRHLTDGLIPRDAVATLSPGNPWRKSLAALLAPSCGLWERVDGGYRIHDYHEYNETAAAQRARIAAGKERKRRWANRRVRNASMTASPGRGENASIDAPSGRGENASNGREPNASGTGPTRARVPTPTPITPQTPHDSATARASPDPSLPSWKQREEANLAAGLDRAGLPRLTPSTCHHGCRLDDENHGCERD